MTATEMFPYLNTCGDLWCWCQVRAFLFLPIYIIVFLALSIAVMAFWGGVGYLLVQTIIKTKRVIVGLYRIGAEVQEEGKR